MSDLGFRMSITSTEAAKTNLQSDRLRRTLMQLNTGICSFKIVCTLKCVLFQIRQSLICTHPKKDRERDTGLEFYNLTIVAPGKSLIHLPIQLNAV